MLAHISPGHRSILSAILLAFLLSASALLFQAPATKGQLAEPLLGVWAPAYTSPVVNDPSKTTGIIRFDINVTDSASFNVFELKIVYDSDVLTFVNHDVNTGTIFGNGGQLVREPEVIPPYVRFIGFTDQPWSGGSGIVIHVDFTVNHVGVSPLGLYESKLSSPTGEIPHTTEDGYFTNLAPARGPVAQFTADPPAAVKGQEVALDGTGSFDPDNATGPTRGIRFYTWFFGRDDGSSVQSIEPIVRHIFGSEFAPAIGTFWVRLIVEDFAGHQGFRTLKVVVSLEASHDLRLFRYSVNPLEVLSGRDISVMIIVDNIGTFPETFNLTLKLRQATIQSWLSQQVDVRESKQFDHTIGTASLAAGAYEATVEIIVPQDDTPNNNVDTQHFRVLALQQSSFPLLVGASVAVAAGAGGVFALRRMRSKKASESSSQALS